VRDSAGSVAEAECAERTDAMAAMWRQRMSLEEIGAKFNLTRERVRQILSASMPDYSDYVRSVNGRKREERDAAERSRCEANRQRVLEMYAAGDTLPAVATATGLTVTSIRSIVPDWSQQKRRRTWWSDSDIVGALRRFGGDSGVAYCAWRESIGRESLPSYETIRVRFGSWDAAREAAGFESAPPKPFRSDRATADDAVESVRRWLNTSPDRRTTESYNQWRSTTPDALCITVVLRRTGSWRSALLAAEADLAAAS
jgi:hypothetical protein